MSLIGNIANDYSNVISQSTLIDSFLGKTTEHSNNYDITSYFKNRKNGIGHNEAKDNSRDGFTPENMLRLVRLSMPVIAKDKLFSELAMDTVKDSIKYDRPVYD